MIHRDSLSCSSFFVLLLCTALVAFSFPLSSSALDFNGTVVQVDRSGALSLQMPNGVAVTNDSRTAFVVDTYFVWSVDVASGVLSRLNTAIPYPSAVGVNEATTTLYVLNGGPLTANAFVWSWTIGSDMGASPINRSPLLNPLAMALAPDESCVFLAMARQDAFAHIVCVSVSTGVVSPPLERGGDAFDVPSSLSLSSDGRTLFLWDEIRKPHLFSMDINTGLVTSFPGASTNAPTYCFGISLDQKGAGVFLTTPDEVGRKRSDAGGDRLLQLHRTDAWTEDPQLTLLPPCSNVSVADSALSDAPICSILSYFDFASSEWVAIQTSLPQLFDTSFVFVRNNTAFLTDSGWGHVFTINVTREE
jgi:hypothetical protein